MTAILSPRSVMLELCVGLTLLFPLSGLVSAQKPGTAPVPPLNLQEELIAERDAASPADDRNAAISHDKARVAWAAKRGGEWALVVNGEQLGPAFQEVQSPTFCGSTPQVAWAAKRSKKWLLVLDGKDQGPEYDNVKSPVCSADGKRLAYAAKRDGKWMMVVDGKEGPSFPSLQVGPSEWLEMHGATFSPDGRRVAHLGWTQVGPEIHDSVVVDGEVGPAYRTIYGPSFSADGQHIAYAAARKKNDDVLFVDGKPGPVFENIIAAPAFSPDGQHVALMIWKDKKLIEVVDGKPGREFPAQRGANFAYGLTFSPDGQRLAYVVGVGGVRFAVWGGKRARKRVVLDGQEGKEYDSIGLGSLTFSADGRHLVYAVHDFGQTKSVVVLDGQEGPLYDQLLSDSLSFSGDRSVVYVARQGRRFLRVTQTLP